ncbi:hypothetical protein [Deinococcus radiotolerans]|uniref:Uncharacterized protein n=1 Tax=Deinococcus radiotolerans TaxID=1309407 RepID=A0ABQ2FQH2_9DEIO|nr:hypothetical protein [Deinococcus radiotolerans]GGL16927.1 hypothetical protein GCM10010844_39790 [Deinococcus radiotolerans]
MTDVARFVQDHPYQLLYALIGLGVLLVINEIRHAAEKAAIRRAFLRPAAPAVAGLPAAVPVAAAPNRSAGTWGGVLLTGLLIGGGLYVLPSLLGQNGQGAAAAPVASALTNGTFRGAGTSPVGSADLTLEVDLLGSPRRVVLVTSLGTFWMRGEVVPESTGTYLSGDLIDANGAAWGTMKAHVTPTRVTGTAGAGPLQWQLDLRR